MPGRFYPNYLAVDVMGDMLGRGKSSRLYEKLVVEKRIFNSLGAYVTGSVDPGLFVISGKMAEGVSLETGEKMVWEVLDDFLANGFNETELQKVKNKAESTLIFSEVELLNRAMNLAFAALVGDPEYVNREPELVQAVTPEHVKEQANRILDREGSSVLYYKSKRNEDWL